MLPSPRVDVYRVWHVLPRAPAPSLASVPRHRRPDPDRDSRIDRDLVERLVFLHQDLLKIVEDFNPTTAAAEETFVNQNATSTLKLGLARGAILLAPALSKIPITEYAPNRVKKSLVGVGHASKEQIKIMVGKLLPKITVTCSDSADALAVAICHAHYSRVDLKFGSTNEKTLYRKSKTAASNRMNDLINRALIKEALR